MLYLVSEYAPNGEIFGKYLEYNIIILPFTKTSVSATCQQLQALSLMAWPPLSFLVIQLLPSDTFQFSVYSQCDNPQNTSHDMAACQKAWQEESSTRWLQL